MLLASGLDVAEGKPFMILVVSILIIEAVGLANSIICDRLDEEIKFRKEMHRNGYKFNPHEKVWTRIDA